MFGKKYTTPEGLQKALITSVGALYGLMLVLTVNNMYQQALSNPGMGSFWGVLVWQSVPLALFGLAYYFNPRKKLAPTQRMFESVLIVIIGMCVFTFLSQLVPYIMSVSAVIGYDSLWLYELLFVAIMLVGFATVLWYLGRSKRWK